MGNRERLTGGKGQRGHPNDDGKTEDDDGEGAEASEAR